MCSNTLYGRLNKNNKPPLRVSEAITQYRDDMAELRQYIKEAWETRYYDILPCVIVLRGARKIRVGTTQRTRREETRKIAITK